MFELFHILLYDIGAKFDCLENDDRSCAVFMS